MKVGKQYIIPFKGLKEGKHDYDFQIDRKFFEHNDALGIKEGDLNVKVVLDKKSSFLQLQVNLEGKIDIQCDRCLEYFKYQVDYSGELYVKFKEEHEEPDENVIFLHPNDDELDLNQYFFDSIGLCIPIQKFHPEDENGNYTCNDEMLNILEAHSSEEENNKEEIDPRWSKLKDLLNDDNKKQ